MSSKLLEDDELLIEERDSLTESQSNESRNTDEGHGPGCALHNYRNLPQEEEDLEYYATLKEKEEDWFAESQTYFQKLKWYVRPSKKVIYLILSIHTLSFTILMGPLMMLMLDNICTSHMKKVFPKPTCHHGGHMNMAANHTKRMDMGNGPSTLPTNGPTYRCKYEDAQKVLSNVQSTLSIISGVLGFTLSGKFGQFSDRFGRVFVFKIFAVINLLHTVGLLMYFMLNEKTFNSAFLISVSSVGYFSGGIMTLLANGNSYLNDIVLSRERTFSISLLMSFVYAMLGVGPLLGSLLVKLTHGNNLAPLVASLVFGIISAILIFTIMVETRHPEARKLAQERYEIKNNRHMNHSHNVILRILMVQYDYILSFFRPMKRLWIPKTMRHGSTIPRYNVITLILVDVFNMASTVGTFHVVILYCMLKYKWSSVEIGYYMSMGGFGRAAVLLFIAPVFLKILEKKFGYKIITNSVDKLDKTSIMVSLIFVFLSSLSIFIFDSSFVVYLSSVLQSLSGLVSPTIQSSVIKYSNKTEAGEMFGAMALVRHLAMLIMPVFFLQIYSRTVDINPLIFNFITCVGSVLTLTLAAVVLRVYEEQLEEDPELTI